MVSGETCVTSLHKSAITKPALTAAISRQVPFPVINSPNSLDRNVVESSDLARSFLTSLIPAPLSPGRVAGRGPVNVRPRDNLFSFASHQGRWAISSREETSSRALSSAAPSGNLEWTIKTALICVWLSRDYGDFHAETQWEPFENNMRTRTVKRWFLRGVF